MCEENDFCVADLRVLLHYYAFPGPFPEVAPVVERAHRRLLQTRLLHAEVDPDRPPRDLKAVEYSITEKGRAHVDALLGLPLPERVWVTPGSRP